MGLFQITDITGALKKTVTSSASSFTLTTTGNVDDLDFTNASLIRFNNASLATLRGLKAGTDGQRVTIMSIGAGQVDLAHQNSGSSAANRLINTVSSGNTSLAAGSGVATYQYDGTTQRWRLVAHTQGAYLNVAYSAGNFAGSGGMSWSVDSGDQLTYAYYLIGHVLHLTVYITTSTTTGTGASTVRVTIPAGYTAVNTAFFPYQSIDTGDATVAIMSVCEVDASGTQVLCYRDVNATAWSIHTNTIQVRLSIAFEIS